MDFFNENEYEYIMDNQDEIGLVVDGSGSKKLVFVEKRHATKTTREINWTLKSELMMVDGKQELGFSNLLLDVYVIRDNVGRIEEIFFLLPINNRIGFLFRMMENGYGMIFKNEFKKFKKKSKKTLIKSLSIPVFYANMWYWDRSVDAKYRTKVVQHLSYATITPTIEANMFSVNEAILDDVILHKPFTVALVGNIGNDTSRQKLLDQHVFNKKTRDSYRVLPYSRNS